MRQDGAALEPVRPEPMQVQHASLGLLLGAEYGGFDSLVETILDVGVLGAVVLALDQLVL